MSADVIVATERLEVVGRGAAAFGPGDSVIEITVGSRHPTPGEDTCGVMRLDRSALICARATPGSSDVNDSAVSSLGDGVPPLGVGLILDDMPGDVGDDRPVAGQVSRMVCQCYERVKIDANVDHASPFLGGPTAEEKVEEHVGTELIHRPCLTATTQASGDPVDTSG